MNDAQECKGTTKTLHKWAELVLRELRPGLLTKAPGSLAGGLESLPREMNELTVFPCAGDGQASQPGWRRPAS